jgi:hypothetical protein
MFSLRVLHTRNKYYNSDLQRVAAKILNGP